MLGINKFLASLDRFLFPEPGETPPETPPDVCANCWGHYEYADMARTAVRDRNIDVRNKRARETFIQAFVTEHVDGIRLRPTDAGQVCPRCSK